MEAINYGYIKEMALLFITNTYTCNHCSHYNLYQKVNRRTQSENKFLKKCSNLNSDGITLTIKQLNKFAGTSEQLAFFFFNTV